VNAAEEVVAALRPAMATMPGTKLLAISSPYTPTGWLYRFYQAHLGQPGPHLVWRASSRTMNPTLSEAKIARAIAEDPERGRAEWEAEWRAGLSKLLDHELVDAAVRSEPAVLPPQPGVAYRAGCDPSGGGSDEFAWAIAHREGQRVVVDVVAARGRRGRAPLDLEAAVADCAADLQRYGIGTVTGDRYAGAWVEEAFGRHGITYEATAQPKSELYLGLLPLVTAGVLEVPRDVELIHQLKLLERRRGTGGRDVVDHPTGAHDDRANAVALATAPLVGQAPLGGVVEVWVPDLPQQVVTARAWLETI
jgi:hypothetical protein